MEEKEKKDAFKFLFLIIIIYIYLSLNSLVFDCLFNKIKSFSNLDFITKLKVISTLVFLILPLMYFVYKIKLLE